jgi:dihydrofolate reductase
MRVTLVAAVDEDDLLGIDGRVPWHLPAELAHFRVRTLGRPVVMGRRTHEAIGKVLPGRLNVVLSRRAVSPLPGCVPASSLPEALARAEASGAHECAVIGGGEVFAEAGWVAHEVVLTRVHVRVALLGAREAVYFPRSGWWKARSPRLLHRKRHEADEANPWPWTVETWGLGSSV